MAAELTAAWPALLSQSGMYALLLCTVFVDEPELPPPPILTPSQRAAMQRHHSGFQNCKPRSRHSTVGAMRSQPRRPVAVAIEQPFCRAQSKISPSIARQDCSTPETSHRLTALSFGYDSTSVTTEASSLPQNCARPSRTFAITSLTVCVPPASCSAFSKRARIWV